MPLSTASIRWGRRREAGMISWTDPTRRARSTLCTASYSSATCPSFSEWTARVLEQPHPELRPLGARRGPDRLLEFVTRGSAAVRLSTSRAKTTAAAGAPPMTEA